jgi:hypothetical protein
MSVCTDVDDELALDYVTLALLRGDDDGDGPLDHACPLCGPDRSTEYNQMRAVLRTWQPEPGFITFYCARCEAKGYAHANGKEVLQPRPRVAVPRPLKPRATGGGLQFAEQLWDEAMPRLPADALDYFRWRGIWRDGMPEDGVLRFHPRCPWHGERTGCILGALHRCADRRAARDLAPDSQRLAEIRSRESDDARADGQMRDPALPEGRQAAGGR